MIKCVSNYCGVQGGDNFLCGKSQQLLNVIFFIINYHTTIIRLKIVWYSDGLTINGDVVRCSDKIAQHGFSFVILLSER